MKAQSGFSFLELVVVIAIMAVLGAIAIPTYMAFANKARKGSAAENIRVMKNAVMQYNLDVGSNPRALNELVERPTDDARKARWHGPYIESLQPDPWGNDYVYRLTPGQKNPYELYSMGSSGDEGEKEERIGIVNK